MNTDFKMLDAGRGMVNKTGKWPLEGKFAEFRPWVVIYSSELTKDTVYGCECKEL